MGVVQGDRELRWVCSDCRLAKLGFELGFEIIGARSSDGRVAEENARSRQG